jgi:hypothetical protein
MDVDHMSSYRVAKDNDPEAKVNFNKLTGNRYSAMEHLVPEQMFSTEENKAEGISAVKAIAIAAAEAQKIYTITNENLEAALTNISLSEDTEIEIRNSVYAGYVLTAHEKQINFNGWLGEGYIITDPVTGGAAYKISGGGNGSSISIDITLDNFVNWCAQVSEPLIEIFGAAFSKAFVSLKGSIERISLYIDIIENCDPLTSRAAIASITLVTTGIGTLVGIYIFLFPLIGILLAIIFSYLVSLMIDSWKREC